MAIIEVNHVTKEFKLGALHGFRQTLQNSLARLRGQPTQERPLFKALDDINFKVEPGEVLGIIGHNGAGKSTLLKLLANITSPTHGSVNVKGKVAPLIEVGAGLVGDLTGRENIFLNGAILGIPKAEIRRKFDEIVAFAELEEFIDTPIKRYSSGMSVRLGFAIATSVDSDILIVDEVLAVGDLAFQRKCFDRMEDTIKRQGKTVLLVSHNIRQVERLCTRVLMIDHGRVISDGLPKEVCEHFYYLSNEKIAAQSAKQYSAGRNVMSTGEVDLVSVTLRDSNGKVSTQFDTGTSMTIRGEFDSKLEQSHMEIMYGIHTTDMIYIATMGTAHVGREAKVKFGRNIIECEVPSLPLVPGTYALRVGVFDRYRQQLFYGETLCVFTVLPKDIPVTKMFALGLVNFPTCWRFNEPI